MNRLRDAWTSAGLTLLMLAPACGSPTGVAPRAGPLPSAEVRLRVSVSGPATTMAGTPTGLRVTFDPPLLVARGSTPPEVQLLFLFEDGRQSQLRVPLRGEERCSYCLPSPQRPHCQHSCRESPISHRALDISGQTDRPGRIQIHVQLVGAAARIEGSPHAIEVTPTRVAGCSAGPEECCQPDGTVVRPCGPIDHDPRCNAPTTCGSGGFCSRCVCLSADTSIATPTGDVHVCELTEGAEVWSIGGAGQRVVSRIVATLRAPVPADHPMFAIDLDDGRSLSISEGHPLADGRRPEELRVSDLVDGSAIGSVRRVAYQGSFTCDVRPETPSRIYFANGIPVRSIL